MGAYYKAVIDNEKSYNPHDFNNGYKLMEHSYIDNDYMIYVMRQLAEPAEYIHLCDYHESDIISEITWEDLLEDEKIVDNQNESPVHPNFIINHSKKSYISVDKLKKLFAEKSSIWTIHPIPILCNSQLISSGGGDYHKDDSRRSTWANDTLQTTDNFSDIPTDYLDITSECLFFE